MGETVNKVIFKGCINVLAGQVTRYPAGGSLPTPWTGFYFHNLSKNYLYADWDADADAAAGFPIYDWDWRVFEDFAVRDYISFLGASAATVYLMGFTRVELKYIAPNAIIGGDAPPFSPHPLVSDPEFHKSPKKVDDLAIGPEYDYEDYLEGGSG